ncbi:TIR domain-containing protein [Wenzhouxiangella sp. XN201]|uniref:toll/interleukin-1 receptor domain-containing protein n=1 Tax=Wenzhouxiangella sp. XN201 TaxID=2710755 RepID=UPI0013CB873B|nr:toll/interleukin-1 receptor domain-containing protein [Wenzhouxiangella sp. XN201]NEZ04274.1 TIR domain-containing protein [Wenzhouxiangella sp. XN201]
MKYWAYLSYAHADEQQARRVHRRIESFRVPRSLRGQEIAGQVVGARLRPLFRDRDDLASSGDLRDSLEAALRESGALIVLCSPAAATSKWVNQEIRTFVAVHGTARVFPLIVAGEPNSGGEDECFPPALRGQGLDGLEPIAGDLRAHADGPRDGVLKIVAGLLGVGFDAIKRRDARRRQRTAVGFAVAASLVAVVTSLTALYAIEQRDIAQVRRGQAEDLIGFMLGDLRTRLQEVGRLDVLDAVGEKAETYFASLPAGEINDHALEKQALALRQIGEVRLQQGQHAAAQRAFSASLAQFEVLAARNPQDAEVLFERSQAEFWLGASHYQALELDRARPLFERYAQSAAELVALDADNPDYRLEEAYAMSNLGSLAVDQGDLDAADAAFTGAGVIFAELASDSPDDPNLKFEVAANDSWLAAVREAGFDWEGAARFRRAAADAHAAVTRATDHPFHRRIEAEAWTKRARAEFALGRVDAALEAQSHAIALYDTLASGDPDNLEWRVHWLSARTRLNRLARFATATEHATAESHSAFDELLAIAADDSDNSMWAGEVASAGLDLALVRLLDDDPVGADDYLTRITPLVMANLSAAPDDHITARQFYELAVLQQLAGGKIAVPARTRLAERPDQLRANRHLAALLARLDGDAEAAEQLDEIVRQAGFQSPDYRALDALARR